MGIRETLNENPRLTTGITIGIIVAVLLFIVYQIHSSTSSTTPNSSAFQNYFTDDDGKTWFADDAKKIPPFDHNGKEAVRAHVYKCDGKTFVNHLERYTPEAKKKMETLISKAQPGADPTASESIQSTGREVKKPGDKDWVKAGDQTKFNEVIRPNCKDLNSFEMVTPQ